MAFVHHLEDDTGLMALVFPHRLEHGPARVQRALGHLGFDQLGTGHVAHKIAALFATGCVLNGCGPSLRGFLILAWMAVQVQSKPSAGTAAIGIDLGLKECATTSTGDKIEGRWYRSHEKALGMAQRAKKKNRAHATLKHQRPRLSWLKLTSRAIAQSTLACLSLMRNCKVLVQFMTNRIMGL